MWIIGLSVLGIGWLVITSASRNVLYIEPVFTNSAYQPHGFYDYYNNKCDTSCLTVPLKRDALTPVMRYAENTQSMQLFNMFFISHVTDMDVSLNPHIIDGYSVIVLHNEYMTQAEYDILAHHNDTYFLYPNSMYALVNYTINKVTLVKGHHYLGVGNAFNWQYDNSKYEQEPGNVKVSYNSCEFTPLTKIQTGYQFNCYPNSPHNVLRAYLLWLFK